jgi:hypothetical protein
MYLIISYKRWRKMNAMMSENIGALAGAVAKMPKCGQFLPDQRPRSSKMLSVGEVDSREREEEVEVEEEEEMYEDRTLQMPMIAEERHMTQTCRNRKPSRVWAHNRRKNHSHKQELTKPRSPKDH